MFISNVIIGILTLFQGNYDENVRFINHHNSHNHSFEVGENGYMRMVKNTTDSKGMCGLTMDPSYPVIKVWN